ncbi:phosphoribosyltransferase family protein [Shewanella phaeophyticola]|uniref:Phosphoribosyltransferase family protein n=1 Tax=Shewanella phaeophyticola TaxID=2978345 RepID=A0ABT2P358_9GAMM|nr:phosphoribosyltransferase family protein [Shewanella sp. KJ10-1]MCT8987054.1 phosphoribosyltransferase family protein [Shewanella sp. KJ10-1]
MIYKSYNDLSRDISANVHKLNYQNFDLIVGIPRSGMVPSYMVSLLLNVHCIDLPAFIRNEKLSKGITRNVQSNIIYAHDAKKILLIDDSIMFGRSIKNSLEKIPSSLLKNITTAVVYSSKQYHENVDIIFVQVEPPRVFEWNIYHHPVVSNSCFDIDGVLCFDPTRDQNDDGEKYIDFIKNAKPRYIPTVQIDYLVTNRLEKYRKETENWLIKYGVKYNKLIMLDLPSKAERMNQSDYFAHKSKFYKNCKSDLFVESDINQAIEIANYSNKFVFCVDENIMVRPGGLKRFKNKKYFLSKLRNKLSKIDFFKKLYYTFK